jgi:pimeloyl-ACP methyl ester carboxylesterase
MDQYVTGWQTGELLRGLDYLERQRLSSSALPACPTTIVHGERDSVAPIREARQLAEGARHAELRVIPGAGHAAFMTDEFKSVLQQCLIPS